MNPIRNRFDDGHSNTAHSNTAHSNTAGANTAGGNTAGGNTAGANGNGRVEPDAPLQIAMRPVRLAARKAADAIAEAIVARPATSLAAATAIGFLLGQIWKRK